MRTEESLKLDASIEKMREQTAREDTVLRHQKMVMSESGRLDAEIARLEGEAEAARLEEQAEEAKLAEARLFKGELMSSELLKTPERKAADIEAERMEQVRQKVWSKW